MGVDARGLRVSERGLMKIRIVNPTTARLNLEPGDELHVSRLTPELETILNATRLDGQKVARIVRDDDDEDEMAVVGRGRRHAQRSATVSG